MIWPYEKCSVILRQNCLFVQAVTEGEVLGKHVGKQSLFKIFSKIQTSALNIVLHATLTDITIFFASDHFPPPLKIKLGSYHIRWIIERLNKNPYNAP